MNLFANVFASIGGAWSQGAIIILLALSIFGSGYLKGAASVRADIADEKLEIALAYAKEIVANQRIADGLADENTRLRSAQEPKDRLITKEITRYVQVTRPADRCTLPGTWRLRHDAAATGTPDPETGPVAAGTGNPVEDATALEIIGENYLACRDAIAKVAGWQRRYQTLEAAQ